MGYTPSLHLLQAKIDELHLKNLDVHTVGVVLHDGNVWQITIEASDEDCENHRFLYELDLHGFNLTETERHFA